MKGKKNSEDIASEPYTSRGDDASGTFCSMENYLSANLCCNNRWRYTFWSFAKRRLAKFNGLPSNKFFLHLKECEFRFNHRHDSLAKAMLKLMRKNGIC